MAYNQIFNLITTGHLWNLTFYMRNGRVIVRQRYNAGGKNIRTLARLLVQTRWANCVSLWKALMPNLAGLFCNKKRQQSDFNAFMQLNFRTSRVRLTKDEVRLGACVVEPGTIVSDGDADLSCSIDYDYNADEKILVTNLCLGSITLNDQTTVATFASALTSNNPARLRQNDRLGILVVKQRFDAAQQIPLANSAIFTIDLDFSDTRTVGGILGNNWLSSKQQNGRNFLAFKCPENQLMAVMHFARQKDNRWECSTQTLAGINTYFASYTSEEAKRKAIDSYGGTNRDNVMSDPNTDQLTYNQVFGDDDNINFPTITKVVIATAVSPAGAGTVSGAGAYNPGTEVTLTATASNPTDKPFTKWSDGVTQNPRTVTATANATYTAIFGTSGSEGQPGGGID